MDRLSKLGACSTSNSAGREIAETFSNITLRLSAPSIMSVCGVKSDTVALEYKGQPVLGSHHQDSKLRVIGLCSHKYLWIIMNNDTASC
jgi:hypothetical protein